MSFTVPKEQNFGLANVAAVNKQTHIMLTDAPTSTYDHRSQKIDHPVRSGVLKLRTGRLVVRWVITSEYRLLYVLPFLSCCSNQRQTADGHPTFR